MGDEPFTTRQRTSHDTSRLSRTSTSPHQAAYASKRAELLFGCYRRGDANDPETYVAAISAVLARYEPELIREVTDPNTGIQTTEKHMSFMPNAGELKVYCETVGARRDRLKRLGERRVPEPADRRLQAPPPALGDLANVFVPSEHPRYPRICEWAKSADPRLCRYDRGGLWVGYNALDNIGAVGRRMGDAARELAESIRKQRAQPASEAANG